MLSEIKTFIFCTLAALLVCPMVGTSAQAQDCSACASGSFGFPAPGSCGKAGCGLKNGELKQSLHAAQARNAVIAKRNDAWPKPFSCVDRQAYESAWRPFIDSGYERQCVLSTIHFDETGELNRFGKTIVTGLVQNMPQARKTIFVHRDSDQDRSQQRLDNVRESIEYMFGHMTPAQVAFSDQVPVRVSASRVETLQALETSATPVPIIPIAAGTDTVQSGVSQ